MAADTPQDNSARAVRNALLRALGVPTPHETKRAARKAARRPLQEAYEKERRQNHEVETREGG